MELDSSEENYGLMDEEDKENNSTLQVMIENTENEKSIEQKALLEEQKKKDLEFKEKINKIN